MPVDIIYGSPGAPSDPDLIRYMQELKDTKSYAYELVRRNLCVSAKRQKRKYDMNVQVKHCRDKVWVFIPRKR